MVLSKKVRVVASTIMKNLLIVENLEYVGSPSKLQEMDDFWAQLSW